MGVYVFKSSHGPYWKVGHYKGQNAWSRVAHRGFYSCRRPHQIHSQVSVQDLELHCWYPTLTTNDEKMIHRQFPGLVGEWYGSVHIGEVLLALEQLGSTNTARECDLKAALSSRRRL